MRAHTFLYETIDPTREDLASVAQWLRAEPDQIEVHIKQEPIDKFLGQIKEMHGTFGEFPKDERRTNKILRLLKQGATPMPMYVEQDDPDLFVMEGRHRMVAFWLASAKTVPVAYVSKKLDETINPDILDPRFNHTQKMRASDFIAEYEGSVTPTENSKAIFSKLEGLGYSKLGSGADATVWAKDSDHVIKILMPRRTLPSEVANAEKGFLEFYNFCKDHSDVPNLPRFIDIGGENHAVFEINGTPYRQIAMERLQHIPRRSFEEAMVWMLSDLAKNNASWGSVVRQLRNPRTWSGSSGMTKISDQVAEKFADPAVSKQYGILYLTMSRLYHSGLRSGLGWDLHTDNVMMRRDGTLVVVDPYFT